MSSVADFFVIATGTSDRQMRAVADHLREFAKEHDYPCMGVEGYEQTQWILLDFVDVIVHVFDQQRRTFYDLELLWGDVPKVDWLTGHQQQL